MPEQIAEGIGESVGNLFDNLGTSIRGLFPGTDYSVSKSPDPAMHLELGNFHIPAPDGAVWEKRRKEVSAAYRTAKHREWADKHFPGTDHFVSTSSDPAMHLELGNFHIPDDEGAVWEKRRKEVSDAYRTAKHREWADKHFPGTDHFVSTSSDPAMHMELNDFFMTVEEGKRIQTDNVERLTSSLDEVTPSASHATEATGGLWDSIHELDGGVSTLGGTVDLATLGMHGMQTSMVAGGREALAYAGHLGTAEAQIIRLLAAQARWARRGGRGRSASSHGNIEDDFLSTPAPSNVEELFQQQKTKGHDISGFRDAHHWWEKHLEHVAQLKAAGHAFAQGTAFAPGGMALVGEMGPELVNLPRGSQVIPNPRLGSEVTVNVTVEGSVVAERDLAQRIRQELIRTSRRTVDLGFVA